MSLFYMYFVENILCSLYYCRLKLEKAAGSLMDLLIPNDRENIFSLITPCDLLLSKKIFMESLTKCFASFSKASFLRMKFEVAYCGAMKSMPPTHQN